MTPMSEFVLGPALHRESRRAQIEENQRLARIMVERFAEIFVIPPATELKLDARFSLI